MPEQNLYVISPGGTGDGSEEWVSPRPVDEVVEDLVTDSTDLSSDDLDDLDEYVDRADLAAFLDGESADDPFTFTVEGHDVTVTPDGTVDVDPA